MGRAPERQLQGDKYAQPFPGHGEALADRSNTFVASALRPPAALIFSIHGEAAYEWLAFLATIHHLR